MCFSLLWFVQLLVWVVVLCGVVAVFRILMPWLLGLVGWAPAAPVMQILNIIFGVVVIVALIWLVYDVITCVGSGPGLMRMR